MLPIQKIRSEKDLIIEKILKIRKQDVSKEVNEIFKLDLKKRETQAQLDHLSSKMNSLSSQIGDLYKNGAIEKAANLKSETSEVKEKIKEFKLNFNNLEQEIKKLLYKIPNIPHDSVPSGKSDADNEIIYTDNVNVYFKSSFLPHWELANKYDLIDFELGVKITGSGFPVYKGKGAILQRALIQFFLNEANQKGFQELLVPHLVNEDSGFGTGQLPDKEGQMYHVLNDDLYLIPTAEVPVTNIYRNEIINEDQLPLKHVSYTPCFRREAGFLR